MNSKIPLILLLSGVNDVKHLFMPTYVVVLNPLFQFAGYRFDYVRASKARAIFTQLDLKLNHPNVGRIDLGQRGGTDLSNPAMLHYNQNSPYVTLCLAAQMGAKIIGLIGVDLRSIIFLPKSTFMFWPGGGYGDENTGAKNAATNRKGRRTGRRGNRSAKTTF